VIKVKSILQKYSIPIAGLSSGTYAYSFVLDNEIFEFYDHPDVKNGTIKIELTLIKRSNVFEIDIKAQGILEVQCDRCLDLFDYPIETTEHIICTIGQQEGYTAENIIVLNKGETSIELGQEFYEIVVTEIPIQKLHPLDENQESTCNPEMMKLLNQYTIREDKTSPMQTLGDII